MWIEPSQKDHAQTLGYTVVDPGTVVATHLNQIMSDKAADLIGHEEVQQMLNLLEASCPKLVEELVPGVVNVGGLLNVLQRLLRENIPVRDLRTISEALVASKGKDPITGKRSPGASTSHHASACRRSRRSARHLIGSKP